jgi:hypothetical protein
VFIFYLLLDYKEGLIKSFFIVFDTYNIFLSLLNYYFFFGRFAIGRNNPDEIISSWPLAGAYFFCLVSKIKFPE